MLGVARQAAKPISKRQRHCQTNRNSARGSRGAAEAASARGRSESLGGSAIYGRYGCARRSSRSSPKGCGGHQAASPRPARKGKAGQPRTPAERIEGLEKAGQRKEIYRGPRESRKDQKGISQQYGFNQAHRILEGPAGGDRAGSPAASNLSGSEKALRLLPF